MTGTATAAARTNMIVATSFLISQLPWFSFPACPLRIVIDSRICTGHTAVRVGFLLGGLTGCGHTADTGIAGRTYRIINLRTHLRSRLPALDGGFIRCRYPLILIAAGQQDDPAQYNRKSRHNGQRSVHGRQRSSYPVAGKSLPGGITLFAICRLLLHSNTRICGRNGRNCSTFDAQSRHSTITSICAMADPVTVCERPGPPWLV